MRIGVPKEIKNQEYRVGMVPGAVRELTKRGHEVWVEHRAGAGIGIEDEDYIAAGARIASEPQAVFSAAELIVKVKEPQRGKLTQRLVADAQDRDYTSALDVIDR